MSNHILSCRSWSGGRFILFFLCSLQISRTSQISRIHCWALQHWLVRSKLRCFRSKLSVSFVRSARLWTWLDETGFIRLGKYQKNNKSKNENKSNCNCNWNCNWTHAIWYDMILYYMILYDIYIYNMICDIWYMIWWTLVMEFAWNTLKPHYMEDNGGQWTRATISRPCCRVQNHQWQWSLDAHIEPGNERARNLTWLAD